MSQSPPTIIVVFALVATLIAGVAAPAAGFAIFVLGLLAALIVDFSGWRRADDAGEHGPSPLGLMEPLASPRQPALLDPPRAQHDGDA